MIAETPIYDDLLCEYVSPPLYGDDFLQNFDLFSVWRAAGLPSVDPLPPLYHYFRVECDPRAPGITDRLIPLTDGEWVHQQWG